MQPTPDSRPPIAAVAQRILDGFNAHYYAFHAIASEAKRRFEGAQWQAVAQASRDRINFYDERVAATTADIARRYPEAGENEALWRRIKSAFISLLHESAHLQPECAETFYNSVACRLLHRRYYQNSHIFWRPAISTEHLEGRVPTYRSWYPGRDRLRECFADIIDSFDLSNPWVDRERDLDWLIKAFDEATGGRRRLHPNHQLQVLGSLFFRNKGAYIVGRELNGHELRPFVIPVLRDSARRLYLDALVVDASELSHLFSFSRAYFMVEMEVPSAYMQFLRSMMPRKPKAEIYSLLGLHKQGKTMFYRELHHHLDYSSDNFCVAPGIMGMVMLVFHLPSMPFVFKLIKDKFEPPKESNKDEVKAKYQLVKHHDRVGRLADTLEYSDVALPLDRIDPELLALLQRHCASAISIDGEQLLIEHVYIERRMTPLNTYLTVADEQQAQAAISDYGQAIRDLASANIFPGDMMLKNFGVTNTGRVVFYDYDEIVYMTECRFRRVPPAPPWMDELSSEPWYSVQANDVFPEQFEAFFFADPRSKRVFYRDHADLLDPAYWNDRKQAILDGHQEDVFPYAQSLRFGERYGAGGA